MKRNDEQRADECAHCMVIKYGAPLMCSLTRVQSQWRREGGVLTRTVSGGLCAKLDEAAQ